MIAYVYNDANPGTLGVIIKGQTLKKESFDTTTYRKEKCKTNNNFRGVRLKSGRSPADIRIQNNRRQQSSKHQLYVMGRRRRTTRNSFTVLVGEISILEFILNGFRCEISIKVLFLSVNSGEIGLIGGIPNSRHS